MKTPTPTEVKASALDSLKFTTDPLQGWFALAAKAKADQQKNQSKRIWKRGRK